ncbi:MAG: radical SAM protein, partial [Deltaproteobacteria bacterium]|nr:radical SAM protein [Deltaproteobacteria bacterium]
MHKEAMLYETMEDKKVHCFLCRHHCKIVDSRFGFCNVRQNIDGRLYTHAYGEVVAAHVDPIEKKPLYHFLPGTFSFSIAAKGCNFRCGFCQNWQISQVSEENATNPMEHPFSPEDIVKTALKEDCRSISYTYT